MVITVHRLPSLTTWGLGRAGVSCSVQNRSALQPHRSNHGPGVKCRCCTVSNTVQQRCGGGRTEGVDLVSEECSEISCRVIVGYITGRLTQYTRQRLPQPPHVTLACSNLISPVRAVLEFVE